jgi:hypothetical protein
MHVLYCAVHTLYIPSCVCTTPHSHTLTRPHTLTLTPPLTDAEYAKGWYRRASAHLGMGKLKEALDDYRAVLKINKTDRTSLLKVKAIKKEIREQVRFTCACV